jgi:hypothetical protein
MRGWAAKDYYPPKPEYIRGCGEAKCDDYHDLLIQEEVCPTFWPPCPPSCCRDSDRPGLLRRHDHGRGRFHPYFLDIIGARNIAMFIGVICGWLLAVAHKDKTWPTIKPDQRQEREEPVPDDVQRWVSEALERSALIPLIVTGFGGGSLSHQGRSRRHPAR